MWIEYILLEGEARPESLGLVILARLLGLPFLAWNRGGGFLQGLQTFKPLLPFSKFTLFDK